TLRREDASWDRYIVEDSLKIIEEEADHLTELIDNLLDASRLQAGALAINLSEVALDALVERIVERFQTQSTRHNIEVDFSPDFPVILADEDRLAQVLSNLLSNSIKYSVKGGDIQIVGQVRPDKIVVCVSDQGSGIAPEDIPHVFDRFYRASEASRTTKGAGLGLYLTRAIIEAHGGRIWVDPKPGGGARICFSLPRDVKRVG
ncbi:MAG TPA: histidine kinase, partial [bacterium]|nr:histidine kinase [bacterium]